MNRTITRFSEQIPSENKHGVIYEYLEHLHKAMFQQHTPHHLPPPPPPRVSSNGQFNTQTSSPVSQRVTDMYMLYSAVWHRKYIWNFTVKTITEYLFWI